MIIKSIGYDKEAFDYRQIFLTDADGQQDKVLAARYPTRDDWEVAIREKTQNLFADIDPNRRTVEQFEKLDAIAETVFEKVKRTMKIYNPVPMMFDVKGGVLGKTLEAHEIQGAKVYNRAYGGFLKVSALKHVTYTVATKPSAVHFSLPVEQLKTGRYTVADLVFQASQAILRYKINLAYQTLLAAYTAGATYSTNAGSVSLTATVLNSALKTLLDEDTDNVKVVGRYKILSPISDFTGYADVALEEIRKMGGLGRYRGADLIKLKYVVDDVYATVPFATTSLFLCSQDKVWNRFVEVGGLDRATWIDQSNKTFHLTFSFEDGAAVWKTKYGHRIYNTV